MGILDGIFGKSGKPRGEMTAASAVEALKADKAPKKKKLGPPSSLTEAIRNLSAEKALHGGPTSGSPQQPIIGIEPIEQGEEEES